MSSHRLAKTGNLVGQRRTVLSSTPTRAAYRGIGSPGCLSCDGQSSVHIRSVLNPAVTIVTIVRPLAGHTRAARKSTDFGEVGTGRSGVDRCGKGTSHELGYRLATVLEGTSGRDSGLHGALRLVLAFVGPPRSRLNHRPVDRRSTSSLEAPRHIRYDGGGLRIIFSPAEASMPGQRPRCFRSTWLRSPPLTIQLTHEPIMLGRRSCTRNTASDTQVRISKKYIWLNDHIQELSIFHTQELSIFRFYWRGRSKHGPPLCFAGSLAFAPFHRLIRGLSD